MLPQLEGAVEIMEENAQKIAAYLPPQAEFVFYLDAQENNMSCRVGARYGEREIPLQDAEEEAQSADPWRPISPRTP